MENGRPETTVQRVQEDGSRETCDSNDFSQHPRSEGDRDHSIVSSEDEKRIQISASDKARFQLCERCWDFFLSPAYRNFCLNKNPGEGDHYNASRCQINESIANSCKWCACLKLSFDDPLREGFERAGINDDSLLSWRLSLRDDDHGGGYNPPGLNELMVDVYYSSTHQESILFVLQTETSDPASAVVTARELRLNVADDFAFAQIRGWLKECESHEECPSMMRAELPNRVIELFEDEDGRPKSRLIRPLGRKDHYVALSYCWEQTQVGVTTKANIEGRLDRLEEAALSRTVQDAIYVCRRLGYKHLWIDAICIVQDSKEDMLKELTRMIDIYRNATFSIMAASAKSSGEGFLGKNLAWARFSPVSIPFWSDGGALGLVWVNDFAQYIRPTEPLSYRAWALQEELLVLISRCYHTPCAVVG